MGSCRNLNADEYSERHISETGRTTNLLILAVLTLRFSNLKTQYVEFQIRRHRRESKTQSKGQGDINAMRQEVLTLSSASKTFTKCVFFFSHRHLHLFDFGTNCGWSFYSGIIK